MGSEMCIRDSLILSSSSKNKNVTEFSYLEVDSHMTISFRSHAAEFVKLISNKVIGAFLSSKLRLFISNRGDSEEERLL